MTTIAANLLAAWAYVALGWLGLQVMPLHPVVTGIWPPAGLALVLLFFWQYRLAPGVWLGAVIINTLMGVPLPAAIAIAFGNTVSPAIGAWILSRAAISPGLGRLSDVGALVAAAVGPTVVGALWGVSALIAAGSAAWPDAVRLIAVWWSGDALGVLIVAPVLLLAKAGRLWPPRQQRWEAPSLLIALIVLTVALFSISVPYVYAVSPLTALIALRMGAAGAVMSTLVVTGIAAVSTATLSGPFVMFSAVHNLFLLQLFIGLIAVKGLVLAAAQSSLGENRDRLAELSRRVLKAHENERRLIARGLHDDVGQTLTAVKMGLEGVQAQMGADVARAPLAEQIKTVDGLLRTVRDLSFELHPAILDDLGLTSALRQHVDRTARRAGFRVSLQVEMGDQRLPSQIEAACFRLVLEAMNNIVRHARATDVAVTVVDGPGGVHITVSDNGVGFDLRRIEAGARAGIGLLGLHERAAMVGGEVRVESVPGTGTTVFARFPVRKDTGA